mmetsp:Transcript_43328/g.97510  ORF Transcript_43328/g.97510 Transcript_43328/m.97510 type:complete len:197 (-) Transcript_43328:251-841(-)
MGIEPWHTQIQHKWWNELLDKEAGYCKPNRSRPQGRRLREQVFSTTHRQSFHDVKGKLRTEKGLNDEELAFLINRERIWVRGTDNELNNRSMNTLLCMSPSRFLLGGSPEMQPRAATPSDRGLYSRQSVRPQRHLSQPALIGPGAGADEDAGPAAGRSLRVLPRRPMSTTSGQSRPSLATTRSRPASTPTGLMGGL